MRLQTTNRDLMRIWKVFSPASLPKPLGQPSLHSFHPRLSFQLLKRSERKRENKSERSTQRPLLPALFVGEGVTRTVFPALTPTPRWTYLLCQKISHSPLGVSLCKCTPVFIPVRTGLYTHTHTLCDM